VGGGKLKDKVALEVITYQEALKLKKAPAIDLSSATPS